ncbi:MAG: hypothetical protein ACKVKX_02140 [Pseudomonadales bacterium]|jgi:hypothetical protein
MDLLKSPTGQPSVLSLIAALAMVFLLSACQMPSPTNSSGQSGQSGPSGPSGGGMPSPPSAGSSSPGGNASPPSGPPSGGEQSAGSEDGSTGSEESSGSEDGSSGSGQEDEGQDGASGQQSAGGQQGESVEGLDAQLDASLEGFDDSMGGSSSQGPDEIDILSPSGSTGVASDSDEPLFEEADSGIPGESNADIEQAAQQGSEGSEGEAGSQGAPGAEGEGGGGSGQQQADAEVIPIPEDIDDGQGDDIVLRQIRDAAMKEKDPVLRERLWDEYRRIKNQ